MYALDDLGEIVSWYSGGGKGVGEYLERAIAKGICIDAGNWMVLVGLPL